jgi:hypothetical protein
MEDIHHLKEALEEHYTIAVNWDGMLSCGVQLTSGTIHSQCG